MTKEETWKQLHKLGLGSLRMPKEKWELGGLGAANEHGMEGFNLEGADFSGAYLGAANYPLGIPPALPGDPKSLTFSGI
jgi:hypothetical protein